MCDNQRVSTEINQSIEDIQGTRNATDNTNVPDKGVAEHAELGRYGSASKRPLEGDPGQPEEPVPKDALPPSPVKKRSKGRRKRKGEPKAARKPWHLFSVDVTKLLREENPDWDIGEVQKEVGKRWKEVSEIVKAEYAAKAEEDKARYMEEYRTWFESLDASTQKEVELENEQISIQNRNAERERMERAEEKERAQRAKQLVKAQREREKAQAEAEKARRERERAEKRRERDKEKADKAAERAAERAAQNAAEKAARRSQSEAKQAEKRKLPAAFDPETSNKPPKKPRTAYMYYAAAQKEELKAAFRERHGEESGKELTKAVQAMWKALENTEEGRKTRSVYETKASEDRARYDAEYRSWYEHRSEEEKARIDGEKMDKEEQAKARAAARTEKAKEKAKGKASVEPRDVELTGAPDGLTKDQVVTYMQQFIPRHYLHGETLAWREFIEPMLRQEHPNLQWENNPDPAVDKSILVKSMKAIWKLNGIAKPLPQNLDEMLLLDEELAKVSLLEPYIRELIREIEEARKAEARETSHEKRVEAEEKTLALEKYACETCLVWWCVATRKPSLHSLGTDVNALKFIAEMIQKHWFPNGAPGKAPIDWDAKEEHRRKQIQQQIWRKADAVKVTTKVTSKIVDGKIVWVPLNEGDEETKPGAAEEIDEREAAEKALVEAYVVKIENHLKEFMRAFKSVDEPRLDREVLDKVGIVWGLGKWKAQ